MVTRIVLNPIVGTWRLTSLTEENLETGAVSHPFGVGARALVIYEANGYVATIIYRPEISWNELWNGTAQERVFQVNGDRLEVKSVPAVSALTGARTIFSLAWQRVT